MPKNNKAPKLSKVQQNMLSQAQGMVKSSGQNPAEMQRLTGLYGDMNAPKETPKLSEVQQDMLRQAQGMVKSSGQNPAEMQRLTKMYGDMNAPKPGGASRPQRPMRGGPMRGGPMPGGPMPGGPRMKAGGKVEGMKSGGKVRGAGIARKGVRPCKMR
jgi:hypothetical protein